MPSISDLVEWTVAANLSSKWRPVDDVMADGVRANDKSFGSLRLAELVADSRKSVIRELLNRAARSHRDGAFCNFEVDEDGNGYIRRTDEKYSMLLNKLKSICPFEFEKICAELLTRLGCSGEATKRSGDGGIDFVATGLDILPDGILCPDHCRATVIGQAKKYSNNAIAETALREFVGAAAVEAMKLRLNDRISPMSPVILAFWTTSDFSNSSREFARYAGVWLMDGTTIAKYLVDWQLEEHIMRMEDAS